MKKCILAERDIDLSEFPARHIKKTILPEIDVDLFIFPGNAYKEDHIG